MITPFLFTWFNDELFEFNKMVFVYLMATLIGGAWVGRMIWARKLILRRTWFDLPILVFLASQLLATFFSIHPRTSIFGYYSRFHGGLLSTISYVVLFYAAVSNLSAKFLPRLLKGTFAAALVITFLSIPEHFGRAVTCFAINTSQNGLHSLGQIWQNAQATCWIQDVQSRVFSTFGQPNWLAAYAITLIPLGSILAVTRRPKSEQLFYGVTTVLLFVTLLFTKSRSGFLGLAVGGIFLAVLGGAAIWRRERALAPKPNRLDISWMGVVGILVAMLTSLVWFGTPYTPAASAFLQKISYSSSLSVPLATPAPVVDRLESGGTDSGEIRKIVWEGAFKVWQRYPLFGSGVETFAYSYYQDRPMAHNLVSEWDFLYNKAHNEFLNFLATTGLVGLIGYTLMLGSFIGVPIILAYQQKSRQPLLYLSVSAGVIALSISNFFGFSTVMVSVLLFVLPAMVWLWQESPAELAVTPQSRQPFELNQWLAFGITGVVVVALSFSVGKGWLADYLYYQGKQMIRSGNDKIGMAKLEAAIALTPGEPTFYDEAASDYAQLAVTKAVAGDADTATTYVKKALTMSQKLSDLNPVNVNFYKTQARVFLTLSQFEPSFYQSAFQALKIAHELAPTDAKILYNLALLEINMGQPDAGQKDLEKVVQMKSDYEAARQTLGQVYQDKKDFEAAKQQYQYILDKIQPANTFARDQLAAIATLSAQSKKAPLK
jgi:tetratricopeptide (TPR) repeat protein